MQPNACTMKKIIGPSSAAPGTSGENTENTENTERTESTKITDRRHAIPPEIFEITRSALQVGGLFGMSDLSDLIFCYIFHQDTALVPSFPLPLLLEYPCQSISRDTSEALTDVPCPGVSGVLVGGVSGILRSAPSVVVALAAGIQWFTAGTTFTGTLLFLLEPVSRHIHMFSSIQRSCSPHLASR